MSNPIHCYVSGLQAAFGNISTTGTLYECCQNIAQGDDYNQRFGSHVDFQRLILKGTIRGGTTATVGFVRITVFRARSGLAFAANTTGSYNPVVDSTSTRLYHDKFHCIAGATSPNGPVLALNLNLKIGHRQKYTGAAAGTGTAESVYVIIQSDFVAGATAPTIAGGDMEEYFKP